MHENLEVVRIKLSAFFTDNKEAYRILWGANDAH